MRQYLPVCLSYVSVNGKAFTESLCEVDCAENMYSKEATN